MLCGLWHRQSSEVGVSILWGVRVTSSTLATGSGVRAKGRYSSIFDKFSSDDDWLALVVRESSKPGGMGLELLGLLVSLALAGVDWSSGINGDRGALSLLSLLRIVWLPSSCKGRSGKLNNCVLVWSGWVGGILWSGSSKKLRSW